MLLLLLFCLYVVVCLLFCLLLFVVFVVVVFCFGGELVCNLIESCPEELLSQIFREQLIW